MTKFEIVPAKKYHCGQIVRSLRKEHKSIILGLGFNGHQELSDCFDNSSICRSWLIDEKLAGLGGVSGPISGMFGQIWLALTQDALKYPIEMVKEARRQMDDFMILKRELVTTILDGDATSRRFAFFLGFTEHEPIIRVPIGAGMATIMRKVA